MYKKNRKLNIHNVENMSQKLQGGGKTFVACCSSNSNSTIPGSVDSYYPCLCYRSTASSAIVDENEDYAVLITR